MTKAPKHCWWSLLVAVALVAGAASAQPTRPDQPQGTSPAERRPTQPMPVPRTLVKHRGQRALHIDGDLQDWPQQVPVLMLSDPRQLSGTALGSWRGPRDLAAEAFMVWDAQDLFLAVVVSDEWHRALTKDSPRLMEIPPADSVRISFDPRRDTRSIGADAGREEDRDFWLADVEGQGRKVVLWDRLRGNAGYSRGAVAVVKHDRKKGLTTYEARIPWAEVLPDGLSPAPELVIDMQIVVNDLDAVTDPIPQTRIGWTFGTGARIDPGLFGSMMLVTKLERSVERLPEFPSPPEAEGDPVPGPAYWVGLHKRLGASDPVVVTTADPLAELGEERAGLLSEVEGHAASFPRVDHIEYHHRSHRRMRREVAGMVETGLPFFWQYALANLGRRAASPAAVPEEGFRIFRLPTGGWLIRSGPANFGIDPSGYNLEQHIFGALDFAVLTDPAELTKRSDQVLLRLASAKRSFYTHLAFHLPGVDASQMPLVTLGESYGTGGLRVRMLGLRDRDAGLVSATLGVLVEWPDGTVLVHSGRGLTADRLRKSLPEGRQVDLLIVSMKHPDALALSRAVGARLTLLDDVLQCSARAGADGRVPLEAALDFQAALQPSPSVILAPGEALPIAPGG